MVLSGLFMILLTWLLFVFFLIVLFVLYMAVSFLLASSRLVVFAYWFCLTWFSWDLLACTSLWFSFRLNHAFILSFLVHAWWFSLWLSLSYWCYCWLVLTCWFWFWLFCLIYMIIMSIELSMLGVFLLVIFSCPLCLLKLILSLFDLI